MRMSIRAMCAALLMGGVVVAFAQMANAAYPPGGTPGSPVVTLGAPETFGFTGLEVSTPYHGVVHSNPIDLGTHVSDAAGNLSVTFSTAGLDVGTHTVTETAPDGTSVSGTFQVVGATTAASTSSSSGSSGLAFTGAKVTGLIFVALLFFAVGFFALRAGRQRRSARS